MRDTHCGLSGPLLTGSPFPDGLTVLGCGNLGEWLEDYSSNLEKEPQVVIERIQELKK